MLLCIGGFVPNHKIIGSHRSHWSRCLWQKSQLVSPCPITIVSPCRRCGHTSPKKSYMNQFDQPEHWHQTSDPFTWWILFRYLRLQLRGTMIYQLCDMIGSEDSQLPQAHPTRKPEPTRRHGMTKSRSGFDQMINHVLLRMTSIYCAHILDYHLFLDFVWIAETFWNKYLYGTKWAIST
jgi:hypothetical protein